MIFKSPASQPSWLDVQHQHAEALKALHAYAKSLSGWCHITGVIRVLLGVEVGVFSMTSTWT